MRVRISTLIAGAIWIGASSLAAAGWCSGGGTIAAGAAGLLGFCLAERIEKSRIRLPWLWGGAVAAVALAFGIGHLLRACARFPLLGATANYEAIDAICCFILFAPVTAALRASARRRPTFRALEAVALGGILVSPLAAHRDGFVNRPFAFVDSLWAWGWDPLPVYLVLGAGVAVLITLWLALTERAGRRWWLAIPLLVAIPMLWQPALGPLRWSGWSASRTGRSSRGEAPLDFEPARGSKPHPVAVVIFHDDYSPDQGDSYYFRQTSMSRFNGQRLVQALDSRIDAALLAAPADIPGALRTSVNTIVEMAHPPALLSALAIRPAANPDSARFQAAYEVYSTTAKADYSRGAGDAGWDSSERTAYLEQARDPRYAALANSILARMDAGTRRHPAARAVAIRSWLNAASTYSLARRPSSGDPVAEFLFGDRRGYCVHFAHAACLLYRAVGVPARVATGYAVPMRRRGRGSALLIQSSDAHAWPEIYLTGAGWVPLDVTPAHTEEPGPPPADADLQRYWGECARKANGVNATTALSPDSEWWSSLARWLRRARVLWVILPALLLACYGIKAWRRAVPRICRDKSLPVLAYRLALDGLAEAGYRRRFGQSREDFARRLASPAFHRLTGYHLAARLGSREPQPARPGWIALADASVREAAAGVAGWRRWRGRLHPLSWRGVR